MSKIKIEDHEIELVSGGVLLDGWQNTLLDIMKFYKNKYGKNSKQRVKDFMLLSINDPTTKIDENDLEIIMKYIDDNWDLI